MVAMKRYDELSASAGPDVMCARHSPSMNGKEVNLHANIKEVTQKIVF